MTLLSSLLVLSLSARAQELPTFHEVAGAPLECHSAYVFPRSAPMMAPGYGAAWHLEPAKLEGIEWGACSRMVPHDGSTPVWVVSIWEPGFRGNTFCSATGGRLSEVLVVGEPTVPPIPEVKTKWYGSEGMVRGEVPSSANPCPVGDAPQPDPALIAALHPDAPEPVAKKRRPSVAAQLEAGPSTALDGFAIGGRLGVGANMKRFWLGGTLQINTWQAAPGFELNTNEWLYQATTVSPAVWGAWKIDRRGQLRLHGLLGGGPARYQRSWDDDLESGWTGGFFGSAAASYRIVSLNASMYGPGFQICTNMAECDIGIDVQYTLGVLIYRN